MKRAWNKIPLWLQTILIVSLMIATPFVMWELSAQAMNTRSNLGFFVAVILFPTIIVVEILLLQLMISSFRFAKRAIEDQPIKLG